MRIGIQGNVNICLLSTMYVFTSQQQVDKLLGGGSAGVLLLLPQHRHQYPALSSWWQAVKCQRPGKCGPTPGYVKSSFISTRTVGDGSQWVRAERGPTGRCSLGPLHSTPVPGGSSESMRKRRFSCGRRSSRKSDFTQISRTTWVVNAVMRSCHQQVVKCQHSRRQLYQRK